MRACVFWYCVGEQRKLDAYVRLKLAELYTNLGQTKDNELNKLDPKKVAPEQRLKRVRFFFFFVFSCALESEVQSCCLQTRGGVRR